MIRFEQHLDGPIPIRASSRVRLWALEVAAHRVDALLGHCPVVVANLRAAGVELQLIAEAESVTDLPQYVHLKGEKVVDGQTMDERGRGYGGLHPCCGEEVPLYLPSARHADHRDIIAHEVAHAVLEFGLDVPLRDQVHRCFRDALAAGRWEGAYASTNAGEFFAETTMWYAGSHGDLSGLPSPGPGPDWLAGYEPAMFELLDDIYTGRSSPTRFSWDTLEPTEAHSSDVSDRPAQIVFQNSTKHPLELVWIDFQGRRRPYGVLAAGAMRAQPTWIGHAWLLTGDVEHGPFVAGDSPAKVRIEQTP